MLTSSKPQFYRVTPAFNRFELEVGPSIEQVNGQRHRLYGEQAGNPEGVPVICLHGGPGAGSNPATRQFFDPDYYRVIQFDQRGAGKSTPHAEMRHNDTPSLVDDISRVADHLGLKRFILFGGSWGSTLALAYAQAHPQRVAAMVLRGIFLGRQKDLDWFTSGARQLMPEAHDTLIAHIGLGPDAAPGMILDRYYDALMNPDSAVHGPAAKVWSQYEDALASVEPGQARKQAKERFERLRRGESVAATSTGKSTSQFQLAIARAEAHYMKHLMFLPPQGLLAHVDRIAHIPAFLVHGRYDCVCTLEGAAELARHWPIAQLDVIENAGHSTFDAGIANALLDRMEQMKRM